MKTLVRESMLSDAKPLAKFLRKADLRELYATYGKDADVEEILTQSIKSTTDPN